MLKGKQLYKEAREFADGSVIPLIEEQADDDDPTAPVVTKAAELGIALAIDIAESLHRISVKIG